MANLILSPVARSQLDPLHANYYGHPWKKLNTSSILVAENLRLRATIAELQSKIETQSQTQVTSHTTGKRKRSNR